MMRPDRSMPATRNRTVFAGFVLLILVAIPGWANCQKAPSGEKTRKLIFVSIVPQKYFVERIGGEAVQVEVMVPPGANPDIYEPGPRQLKALTRADAYLSIDVPFEKAWLERFRAVNPRMEMADAGKGIQRLGPVENPDPHIWLSPELVKQQARNIHDLLLRLDKSRAEQYQKNLQSFLVDADRLDQSIRKKLSALNKRTFLTFHPAWAYFARAYNLEMMAIETEGQEPGPAELARLIRRAKEHNIRLIFVQPEFNARTAELIARELKGRTFAVSPLAYDWPGNLMKIAEAIAE